MMHRRGFGRHQRTHVCTLPSPIVVTENKLYALEVPLRSDQLLNKLNVCLGTLSKTYAMIKLALNAIVAVILALLE